ncbi:DNA-directed RNA polymerase III subunit RPC4 [Nerophis lumbriciformis]|uniref:DNA-directed RNA polymerase III subunit RPC4 n=1 Tax=Nerophis lumbriciformis TaxID=546530 RepID=UPI002AE081D3|nr:DNA-directed RNA polymerase III subunit RPC4-like [Nerophis lumbriciformis]
MADSGAGDPSGHHMLPPGASARGQMMGRRTPATISAGRLPTMRSRDLTLGGVKKKTFTPNIIGRKVREDTKDEGTPRRDKDSTRGRGSRDRGRGRGRGRGFPDTIQSHSIFEQGPTEAAVKRIAGYQSEREAPSMGLSPIINIKKEKRETEEETKEILRKLDRDDFIDDHLLRGEQTSCPVQLPLAVSGWSFKEESSAPRVKIEKMDEDDPMEPAVQIKEEQEEVEIKKTEATYKLPPLPEPEVLQDLLHKWSLSKNEELFFMQLPDSLPGQPPTKEYKPIKTEVQSEDGQSVLLKTESEEEQVDDNSCNLKDLRDGLVGKMLVRKSGRVQLIMGQVSLDVSLGASCAFFQELVSVSTEGRTGDLTVLGNVKHKIVCSPDFESLLESR